MDRRANMALSAAPSSVQAIIVALANPTRREMLTTLVHGARSVSALAAELELDVSTVSHGLRDLAALGLVSCRHVKRERQYGLAPRVEAWRQGDRLHMTIRATNGEAVSLALYPDSGGTPATLSGLLGFLSI